MKDSVNPMVLVIQSYGNEREYKRAIFCILSYYAHSTAEGVRIFLFTDAPDYFKNYLAELPIQYFLLTPEKIRSIRGEIDFLHRMKIAMIEEAFEKSGEDILYADSDTFFINDPSPLMKEVSPHVSFMHKHEYVFSTLKDMPVPAGEPFQAFYRLIRDNTFTNCNGTLIRISTDLSSWNAGVIFLHKEQKVLLDQVYNLTDQFYVPTLNHASEQYAFSVILQTMTTLKPCDSVIYHYWYRVKKTIVDEALSVEFGDRFLKKTRPERLTQIKKMTGLFPTLLESHILTLRDNAVQSFHENQFYKGYTFALRALLKNPRDAKFIADVLYHTKRLILGGKN